MWLRHGGCRRLDASTVVWDGGTGGLPGRGLQRAGVRSGRHRVCGLGRKRLCLSRLANCGRRSRRGDGRRGHRGRRQRRRGDGGRRGRRLSRHRLRGGRLCRRRLSGRRLCRRRLRRRRLRRRRLRRRLRQGRRSGHGLRRHGRRRNGLRRFRLRRAGLRAHGLRRRGPRRQERQRVAVALWLGGDTNSQVHERRSDLGVARRPDRRHGVAFCHGGALRHRDGAEVRERDGESRGRLDGEAAAGGRHRPGERHDAGRGGANRRTGAAADVDAAMLARRVRVNGVEEERLEDCPVGGPRPGRRRGREDEHGEERRECERTHRHHSFGPTAPADQPLVV
jgi:hypothetical protein